MPDPPLEKPCENPHGAADILTNPGGEFSLKACEGFKPNHLEMTGETTSILSHWRVQRHKMAMPSKRRTSISTPSIITD
jgi:hypothetical protein